MDGDHGKDQPRAGQAQNGQPGATAQVSRGRVPLVAVMEANLGPADQRIDCRDDADEREEADQAADERPERLLDSGDAVHPGQWLGVVVGFGGAAAGCGVELVLAIATAAAAWSRCSCCLSTSFNSAPRQ